MHRRSVVVALAVVAALAVPGSLRAQGPLASLDPLGPAWPAWIETTAAIDLYVAPTGDDANPGTLAAPLRTTAAAVARLAPGVRLNFLPGTYRCNVWIANVRGGPASPVVLRSVAVEGGAVVAAPRQARFDCRRGAGFNLDNVRGAIVDGLEIYNTSGHGIRAATADPWTPGQATGANLTGDLVIRRSFIHDTGLASIKMSQAEKVWILDNTLGTTGRTRQNVEFVAVDDTVVAGNEAYGSGAFNEVKGGSRNALIYRNHVHDTRGGIYAGGDCTDTQFLVDVDATYEARDVRVIENVIVNADSEAVRIVSCHDCLIAHNTYHSPRPQFALRIIQGGFARNTCYDVPLNSERLTIRNNVFAGARAFRYGVIASNVATRGAVGEPFVMTHNAWWAGPSTDVTALSTDIPFAGEPSSLYGPAASPGLVSPPSNVRLRPDSLLVDAGTPITFAYASPTDPEALATAWDVSTDADGDPWTDGTSAAPNIGAF